MLAVFDFVVNYFDESTTLNSCQSSELDGKLLENRTFFYIFSESKEHIKCTCDFKSVSLLLFFFSI